MTSRNYFAWKTDALLVVAAVLLAFFASSRVSAQSIDGHTGAASTISTVAPGGTWTTPSNAAGLDNAWASIAFTSPSDIGRALVASGFTWGVPDPACLVKGVTIRIYARGTGGAAFANVRMAGGTTPYGESAAVNLAIGAEGWVELGGPDQTWGFGEMTWEEWSAGFTGCRLSVKSLSGAATIEIDHIEIVIHTLGDKSPATAITDSGFFLHRHSSMPATGAAKVQLMYNRYKLVPTMLQPVSERVVGSDGGFPLVVFGVSGDPLEGESAINLLPHYYGSQQRGSDTTMIRVRTQEVPQVVNATNGFAADVGIMWDGTHYSFFRPPGGSVTSPNRHVPGFYLNGMPPVTAGSGTVHAPWANLGEGIEDSTDPECYVVASATRRWKKFGTNQYTPWTEASTPEYFRWAKYQLIENTGDGGGGTTYPNIEPGEFGDPKLGGWSLPTQEEVSLKFDMFQLWQGELPDVPMVPYVPPADGHEPGGPTMPDPEPPTAWTITIPLSSWTFIPGGATLPNITFTVVWSVIAPWLSILHAIIIGWVSLGRVSLILEELRHY